LTNWFQDEVGVQDTN